MAQQIKLALKAIHQLNYEVSFDWIPAHCNFTAHDIADKEAITAAQSLIPKPNVNTGMIPGIYVSSDT